MIRRRAMRVCVTATAAGLDAQVDPRFGRAQYFVFVDTDTMDCESVPNPNVNAYGGAGIQSAQLVVDRGAEVVITGHVGPNASKALEEAKVKVLTGFQGMTVREAVERFKGGGVEVESREGRDTSVPDEKERIRREIEELKRRIAELERRLEGID